MAKNKGSNIPTGDSRARGRAPGRPAPPQVPPPFAREDRKTDPLDLSALSAALARCLQPPSEESPALAPAAQADKRGAYRCPVAGPDRSGRLKLGGKTYPIEILEESTTGLGVAVDGLIDFQIGQTALVEVASAWSEVRVMHVAPVAMPPGDDGVDPPPRTRLGLLRLREVDASEVEQQRDPLKWEDLQPLVEPLAPLARTVLGVGALLAGTIVAIIILLWVMENPEPVSHTTRDALRSAGTHSAEFAPPEPVEDEPDDHLPEERKRRGGAKPVRKAKERPHPAPATHSPSTVDTRPAASLPTAAPVAPLAPAPLAPSKNSVASEAEKLLKLAPEQLDRLGEILGEESEAVGQSVHDRLLSAARSLRDDPDHAAARQALEVLNDDQRAALTDLAARPAATEESPAGQPPAEPGN